MAQQYSTLEVCLHQHAKTINRSNRILLQSKTILNAKKPIFIICQNLSWVSVETLKLILVAKYNFIT
jgi:hypothetical protein